MFSRQIEAISLEIAALDLPQVHPSSSTLLITSCRSLLAINVYESSPVPEHVCVCVSMCVGMCAHACLCVTKTFRMRGWGPVRESIVHARDRETESACKHPSVMLQWRWELCAVFSHCWLTGFCLLLFKHANKFHTPPHLPVPNNVTAMQLSNSRTNTGLTTSNRASSFVFVLICLGKSEIRNQHQLGGAEREVICRCLVCA